MRIFNYINTDILKIILYLPLMWINVFDSPSGNAPSDHIKSIKKK